MRIRVRNWREQAPYVGHISALVWTLYQSRDKDETSPPELNRLHGINSFVKHGLQGHQHSDHHRHDSIEQLYFILRGRGQLTIGDDKVDVRDGMAVYMPVNVPHQAFNDADGWMEHLIVSCPLDEIREGTPAVRDWRDVHPVVLDGGTVSWPLLLQEEAAPASEGGVLQRVHSVTRYAVQGRQGTAWQQLDGIELVHYVLGGYGTVEDAEGDTQPVTEGSAVHVLPGVGHRFSNQGEGWFEFVTFAVDTGEVEISQDTDDEEDAVAGVEEAMVAAAVADAAVADEEEIVDGLEVDDEEEIVDEETESGEDEASDQVAESGETEVVVSSEAAALEEASEIETVDETEADDQVAESGEAEVAVSSEAAALEEASETETVDETEASGQVAESGETEVVVSSETEVLEEASETETAGEIEEETEPIKAETAEDVEDEAASEDQVADEEEAATEGEAAVEEAEEAATEGEAAVEEAATEGEAAVEEAEEAAGVAEEHAIGLQGENTAVEVVMSVKNNAADDDAPAVEDDFDLDDDEDDFDLDDDEDDVGDEDEAGSADDDASETYGR